jgi:hypothetical protein
MTGAQIDAVSQALFSVQIIALILQGLGDGETSVDPGVVDWLGNRLDEQREAIDEAFQKGRVA